MLLHIEHSFLLYDFGYNVMDFKSGSFKIIEKSSSYFIKDPKPSYKNITIFVSSKIDPTFSILLKLILLNEIYHTEHILNGFSPHFKGIHLRRLYVSSLVYITAHI